LSLLHRARYDVSDRLHLEDRPAHLGGDGVTLTSLLPRRRDETHVAGKLGGAFRRSLAIEGVFVRQGAPLLAGSPLGFFEHLFGARLISHTDHQDAPPLRFLEFGPVGLVVIAYLALADLVESGKFGLDLAEQLVAQGLLKSQPD